MKKIALVTGGNRGIGKEVCQQLINLNFQVLLGARNKENGEKAAMTLGDSCTFVHLDVNNEDNVEIAAKWVQYKFGKLDVLINNAGIGIGSKGLSGIDMEELKSIMDTNFFGPVRVNKAFLNMLKKSPDGRIINVSSSMGALEELKGGYAGYRLSKAGLNAQTILLSNELKSTKIKVNAVCPGWVNTEMGGTPAPRNVEKGAETIVWLATAEHIPNGKFLRDQEEVSY